MNSYIIPSTLDRDIEELAALIDKFNKGRISVTELKAHRVPFGVYEQRERDTYMVRVRCAGGYIRPDQLSSISALSGKYGNGQIHITTRQELQIHYVKLQDIIPLIKELKAIGLSSRGGGGNSVRNITTQEDAGITKEEVFDVTAYAFALTTRLISEDDSWIMPRKFKVSFSGSGEDKACATATDLGYIACIKDSVKGFKVYIAGGLGAKASVGHLLFDFIKDDQVYNVTKAAKNLFLRYGNRKNKHAARLRFLWQSLGQDEFKKKFNEEYEAVKKQNYPVLDIEDIENKSCQCSLPADSPIDENDFQLWSKRFVVPQRQEGVLSILIGVELGFIASDKARQLGDFLMGFGDNVIRMTSQQNILMRNIPKTHLANVYNFLKKTFDNFNRPAICDRIVSCAGASTCQLGICLSREAAKVLIKELQNCGGDLDRLNDAKINISGCPNSCGQHQLADIGFYGKISRKSGRLYPAYNVVSSAVIREVNTEFAALVGEVSARDLPRLVIEFIKIYLLKSERSLDFKDYIKGIGKNDLIELCKKYADIPDFSEDRNYYFDWGSDEPFSVANRGAGECSAGLFDLIEMDLENIRKTRQKILAISSQETQIRQSLLHELVLYSARMLLITRGLEPKSEEEIYENFKIHFIEPAFIEAHFNEIIELTSQKNYSALLKRQDKILELSRRVEYLYDNMDNAFNFAVTASAVSETKKPQTSPQILKDLRGVACPMNFVKTKIELAKLKPGEILEVWLDDGAPIENVPASVKAEGHKILSQTKDSGHWVVVIQKA